MLKKQIKGEHIYRNNRVVKSQLCQICMRAPLFLGIHFARIASRTSRSITLKIAWDPKIFNILGALEKYIFFFMKHDPSLNYHNLCVSYFFLCENHVTSWSNNNHAISSVFLYSGYIYDFL